MKCRKCGSDDIEIKLTPGELIEVDSPGGGPVFQYPPGLTLRDYFAAAALTGMISSAPIVDRTKVKKDKWAGVAYEFADAMLAAREKRHEAQGAGAQG